MYSLRYRRGNPLFVKGFFCSKIGIYRLGRQVINMIKLTKESLEMLIEEIVNAIESEADRDIQFDMVSAILAENGIIDEIIN